MSVAAETFTDAMDSAPGAVLEPTVVDGVAFAKL